MYSDDIFYIMWFLIFEKWDKKQKRSYNSIMMDSGNFLNFAFRLNFNSTIISESLGLWGYSVNLNKKQ